MAQTVARSLDHAFIHPRAFVECTDIGPNTRVWPFAHVMAGAHLGADCNIGEQVFIESGVWIGNNVTVKNGVCIWTGITVEDSVFLGPHCVLTNDRNPRAYLKKAPEAFTPTLIRAHSTIGANATVVCGVCVGAFAFIGAGAVVVRSVPDHALVVGNPGRQIGWMCICATQLPMPVNAALGMVCVCAECGCIFERRREGLAQLSEMVDECQ
jgi:UDP-2-acetamido-3-amino-2,3-dideoxy-glucuronate N-acetyltransferase